MYTNLSGFTKELQTQQSPSPGRRIMRLNTLDRARTGKHTRILLETLLNPCCKRSISDVRHTFLTKTANRNSRLLPTHNQVRVVLRHLHKLTTHEDKNKLFHNGDLCQWMPSTHKEVPQARPMCFQSVAFRRSFSKSRCSMRVMCIPYSSTRTIN